MGICAAIKPDGVRCRARAMEGYGYCYNHNPEFADERRLHASKGGGGTRATCEAGGRRSARHQGPACRSHQRGALGRGDAGGDHCREPAAEHLASSLELERKWKEVLELQARLEAVEGVLKDRERRRAG
jgi:hypothetical protein